MSYDTAQFNARRATAVQRQADLQKPKPPTSGPAVRNWHFATMVNGQAVPVRMAVAVSFTAR